MSKSMRFLLSTTHMCLCALLLATPTYASTEIESVEQSVHQLFLKLLERDEYLEEFNQAESKVAVICLDWNTVKQTRRTQLLRIERYWYEDEGTLDEMRKVALDKCATWRRDKTCECTVLLEDSELVVTTPQSVNERVRRAEKAFNLMLEEATQRKYQKNAVLRKSKRYLSADKSSPYRTLQTIQKSRCDKPGMEARLVCPFDRAACLELFRSRSDFLGYEPEVLEEISCNQISTKYEIPGVYELLSRYFLELSLAAELVDIPIEDEFAFGSLPTNKINVSISDGRSQGARLMFFNLKFFAFVYEMAKVASLSIPFGAEEQNRISIDISPEGLEAYLDDNPKVERVFLETVLTFLGLANRPPLAPPKNIQPILSIFAFGAEEFAMAHEIAHAVLKHSGEGALNLEGGECGERTQGTWIDEIEADYLGLKLLEGVADLRAACSGAVIGNHHELSMVGTPMGFCEAHPFGLGIPLAAVSYFTAKKIKEEACTILKDGTVTKPDPLELKLLEFSKTCRAQDSCDFLRDV